MIENEYTMKLRHYADMYGQDILSMDAEQARAQAGEYKEQSRRCDPPDSLKLLVKSVHYEAVAQCLEHVGK